MGKKHKEPNTSVKNNVDSDSSNIFKTIFGDVHEKQSTDNSVSIFSDSNRFRRKPNTVYSQSESFREEDVETPPQNSDSQSPDDAGKLIDKKKRKKDKIPNHDSDDENILEVKKSKKGPELDNGLKDMEVNGEVSEKGKKKKRKRAEIEAEYEEKRYGVKDPETAGVEAVGEKRKKLDRPEDMLVSKEGFDDEEKLLRTVFVGNLPLKVKKKALLKEFSQFGDIESVRLRSIPILDDKTPRKGAIIKKQINDAVDRVNAYIVFKKEESAQASLSHNMAVVGGNHIHVDRACPPRKKLKGENAPLYDSKRTVFVGNLPFDVKDEEIYQLFTGIKNLKSNIEAIRVIRDPGTSMGKGIAYVLFETRDAANMVVRKHHLKIRDRELRLYHATSNLTPSERKGSLPAGKFQSPSRKWAVGTTTPDVNNKVKSISYQGMRASKSGVQKKVSTKFHIPVKSESRFKKLSKQKERTGKRPSVAARKAAANAQKTGVGITQAGKKRKAESRTPQSTNRNKKIRKFR